MIYIYINHINGCFFIFGYVFFVIFWVSRVYLGLNLSFPWYQHGPSKNQHVLVRSSSHCWHRSWGRSMERHQMRVERRVVWTRGCHRPARWGTADVIKLGRGFVRFLCKINWNDNLQWYLSLINIPIFIPIFRMKWILNRVYPFLSTSELEAVCRARARVVWWDASKELVQVQSVQSGGRKRNEKRNGLAPEWLKNGEFGQF